MPRTYDGIRGLTEAGLTYLSFLGHLNCHPETCRTLSSLKSETLAHSKQTWEAFKTTSGSLDPPSLDSCLSYGSLRLASLYIGRSKMGDEIGQIVVGIWNRRLAKAPCAGTTWVTGLRYAKLRRTVITSWYQCGLYQMYLGSREFGLWREIRQGSKQLPLATRCHGGQVGQTCSTK
jgi:hypothetical protein